MVRKTKEELIIIFGKNFINKLTPNEINMYSTFANIMPTNMNQLTNMFKSSKLSNKKQKRPGIRKKSVQRKTMTENQLINSLKSMGLSKKN